MILAKLFEEWRNAGIFHKVIYEQNEGVSPGMLYAAVYAQKSDLIKALRSAVRYFDLIGLEIIQKVDKHHADHFELITCADQRLVRLVVQGSKARVNHHPSITLIGLNIDEPLRRELRDYIDKRSAHLLPRLNLLDDRSPPSPRGSIRSDYEIHLTDGRSHGWPGAFQPWIGDQDFSKVSMSNRIPFIVDSASQPELIFQQLEDLALQIDIVGLLGNKLNPGLQATSKYLSESLGAVKMSHGRSSTDRHIWAMSRNGRGYIFPKYDLLSSCQSVRLMTGRHPVKVFIFILFARIATQFNISPKYMGTLTLGPGACEDKDAKDTLSIIEKKSSVGRKAYSIHLGTPVHGRKPVVLVPDHDGQKDLVIKVGWNSRTVELVRREHEVLLWLESKRERNWITSELLWTEETDHKFILASRMIKDYRRASLSDHEEIKLLTPLDDLAKWSAANMPLDQSSFWRMIVGEAAEVTDSYWRSLIMRSIKHLENRYKKSTVTFTISHGDYTPWNIGWSGDRVCVLDWEYSRPMEPIGLDWINWHVEKAAHLMLVEPERQIESTLNYLKHCPNYAQYIQNHAYADSMGIEDRTIAYLVRGLIHRAKRSYGDIPDAFKIARMLSFMLHRRDAGGRH